MTLLDDLPADVRAALPEWLRKFLGRCRRGHVVWVPKVGLDLDARDRRIRHLWHRWTDEGRDRHWITEALMLRFNISSRQLGAVLHRNRGRRRHDPPGGATSP